MVGSVVLQERGDVAMSRRWQGYPQVIVEERIGGRVSRSPNESRRGPQRRIVRNKVKLEPFYSLVAATAGASVWTPTLGLIGAAGLATDREGGRGGLKML